MRLQLGCLPLLLVLLLLVALPFLFIGLLNAALLKLHLSPPVAMLVVLAIFFGSFVNVPVARIARPDDAVPVDPRPPFGVPGAWPRFEPPSRDTIVTVNIGGCFVPLALVAYEIAYLLDTPTALVGLAAAVAANVTACYLLARPVPGIGIAMPGLVSALIAAMAALVLAPQHATPVAFIAGVIGALVGADLMHLRDVIRMASATISIGGAGTFDSILLSGVLAAYLA